MDLPGRPARGRRPLARRALSRRAVRRCGPTGPRRPRPGAPRSPTTSHHASPLPDTDTEPDVAFPATHSPSPSGFPPTTGTATTPRHDESSARRRPLPPSTAPIASGALDREGRRPGRPAVGRRAHVAVLAQDLGLLRGERGEVEHAHGRAAGAAHLVVGGVHRLRVVRDARPRVGAPPFGWFHARPASSVFHSRRSQPSSPPVTKPSVAELGRARSTRPGASWRDQDPPSSSVTHTAPGFSHVPACTTHAIVGPTAATIRSTGTGFRAAADPVGDADGRARRHGRRGRRGTGVVGRRASEGPRDEDSVGREERAQPDDRRHPA